MTTSAISVLHISRADNVGGSARSAYKIHSGLRALGLQSRMMVEIKSTNDPNVAYVHGRQLPLRLLDRIGHEVVDRAGLQYMFYPSSFALLRHPWLKSAQIVQLYNTHGGYFTHRVLPRLSRNHIVVWRLSDMWPLTGHCSYSHGCERWKTGCGSCPILGEYPPLAWDTTALLWCIKAAIYKRSRLVIVATNSWMEGIVQQSPLLSRFPLHRIPNGVDTAVFRPIPKASSREALGILPTAKVVLFAAHVATGGTRKGGEYVTPAMQKLAAGGMENLVLVVVGEHAENWPDQSGYQTLRLGFTQSDRLLAVVYSAADVLVYPAVAENFPNGIVESMACGTPAAAFDTGGIPDAVHHMETGYLAAYKNISDLANGIQVILDEPELRAKMSFRCREVAEQEYTLKLQARRYAELYEALLEARGQHR